MSRPADPELRNRLLAAAAAEFAERGFARATMATIGRRAGVTKGGVYFHFRGKEELFFAVFDARRARLRELLTTSGQDAASGAAVLRRFVRDYLEFHFRDPDASRLLGVLVAELRDRFTAELRE
ncbi:MAG: TetR/AcrR family transcriptional regulator, partial [Planctomycetes bacterium]|nr:TetR/AcrR family transcriptional regulator [Planctomycetota bacterium]